MHAYKQAINKRRLIMAPPLHRTASADLILSKPCNNRSNDSVAGILMEIENQALPVRAKPKQEPKNFGRINLARIREIQRLCRQANEKCKNVPVKPPNKLYRDVPSRLSEYIKTTNLPSIRSNMSSAFGKPEERPLNSNYSRMNQQSRPSSNMENLRVSVPSKTKNNPLELVSKDKTSEIPQIHMTDSEIAANTQRKQTTLEMTNKGSANSNLRLPTQPKYPSSTPKTQNNQKPNLLLPAKYKLGTVPKYLQERQKRWLEEEERRQAEMPDPNIPPGHQLIPEEERTETLEKLRNNYSELLKQMSMLPLRMDTLRIQKLKEDLEKRLVKIEEAIKIFSQPKVFIKKDT